MSRLFAPHASSGPPHRKATSINHRSIIRPRALYIKFSPNRTVSLAIIFYVDNISYKNSPVHSRHSESARRLTLPGRRVASSEQLPSACARVFAPCSGCASNLLVLFERADKTAGQLFIVRRNERERQTAAGLSRVARFVPSSELSSCQIFHPAFFLPLLTRTLPRFISPRRTLADNGRASRKQDSLIWQPDCLQIIKPAEKKNREKSNGLVSTNHKIHDEAMRSSRASAANN